MSKERKAQPAALPLHLLDVLLPGVKIRYNAALSANKQDQYERGLHSIIRQETMRSKGFPLSPDKTESDLEHTYAGLVMAMDYLSQYPILGNYINFEEVQTMYIMHDAGEIIVGDVSPVDRTLKEEQRKRLEPYLAKRRIFSQIPDPFQRDTAIAYFNRYQRNDPNDLEVQMTRFIDKAQGTTRVAHEAFNLYAVQSDEVKKDIALHLWSTLPRMIEPAINLLVGLENRQAKQAIAEITLGELKELEKYGPKEVARTYMRAIESIAA